MSDNYQAVYDAVRSRLSSCDIGEVIREVAYRAFDTNNAPALITQEFSIAAAEMRRPSVLFRPRVFRDGDLWCALYGENLQDGVCAFGISPSQVCEKFDEKWNQQGFAP